MKPGALPFCPFFVLLCPETGVFSLPGVRTLVSDRHRAWWSGTNIKMLPVISLPCDWPISSLLFLLIKQNMCLKVTTDSGSLDLASLGQDKIIIILFKKINLII